MNIPLTPIDEAWNMGKAKHTVANKYATLRTQKRLLNDAGQVTGEFVPTGVDAMALSHQEVSALQEQPGPQREPQREPGPGPGRAQPTPAGKAITVTSPEALEALKPYNDEFISDLVARLVVQHFKSSTQAQASDPKIESFSGRYARLAADTLQDDNVFVTLALAVLLLYSIDILIRSRS